MNGNKRDLRECVVKLKFWFGQSEKDIFNTDKYTVKYRDQYVYLYKKEGSA